MHDRKTAPIFIIGRQHSGNTMLASLFERAPNVLSMKGEGCLFEYHSQAERLGPEERINLVAKLIGGSDSPPLSAGTCDDLATVLLKENRRRAARTCLSTTALYDHGMSYLAARQEKIRWAQKATSYIFHVEAILEAFPQAKLIFLARNPLDIAASIKCRGQRNAFFRMIYGWNKGIHLAERYQGKYPSSFLLIRYEDLVSSPEAYVRKICNFVNLEFDPEYLQVPRVNRAETPYNLTSDVRGMDATRVFHYRDVLTSAEETFIRMGISRKLLGRWYPEISSSRYGFTIRYLPGVIKLALWGGGSVLREHVQMFLDDHQHTMERIRRRLW